jgi:hypothetical protein
VLFIHLFCLFLGLVSNYIASPLQVGLLSSPVIAPYFQFLRLRPAVPFVLVTDNTELTDDYVLEVEVTAGAQKGEIVRFPPSTVAGSASARRHQLLARTIGVTTFMGDEGDAATLSKAVGAYVLDQGPNEEVIVRTRRYQPQPRELDLTNPSTPADPTAPEYLSTAYQARVWRDRFGQVQLLKIEEKKVVAPLE